MYAILTLGIIFLIAMACLAIDGVWEDE